jgi:hypothetical protein
LLQVLTALPDVSDTVETAGVGAATVDVGVELD